jgi:uncharacterized coiled-coil protein SlyX
VKESRVPRRSKRAHTLGEHAIFGDEEAAQLRAELDELRATMAELADRVHSQFTTIAAHAEIARTQAEQARAEARADLDRTRDTVFGLIEQVRAEPTSALHVPGSPPGPSVASQQDRLDALDQRLVHLAQTVDLCFDRQRELADTMAALIDTVFAEHRNEPVAGLALD